VKSKKAKLSAVIAVFVLALTAGCEDSANRKISPAKQIEKLQQENKHLKMQIEQSRTEADNLKEQVQVLSGLPEQVRLETLYNLQKVKISRYTNLYDKDRDGRYETLIVYLQPMDENGDVVKAAGAVDVQLWDLNKQQGQALLGQWHVEPGELKKLWFATLITINYRLTFDVAGKIEGAEEDLVVKVNFTDYLTGRIFKEQRVIKRR